MADCAVRVAVRARPPLNEESGISLNFLPEPPSVLIQDRSYTYDYVFTPDKSNQDVYDTAVADKLQYIFEGYNLTILAYGQTGAGKTYTMGTDYASQKNASFSELGIIPRGLNDIFSGIHDRINTSDFVVKVSFLEVYQEDVYDLLRKTKEFVTLSVREDYDGIKVPNLTEVVVHSPEEALSALEQGARARSTAATAMNLVSSRSHAIFAVHVEQTDHTSLNIIRSRFQLVDLAGSERISRSKTEGVRLKEGITINLGLLCLGNVISALSEEKAHIPYRDSKLTRLLMDTLGGNCHTLLIACVSPSPESTDETLNTLRYAGRARRIKNTPVVNNDPPEVQIQKLKERVRLLEAQLYELQSTGVIKDRDSDNSDMRGNIRALQSQLQAALEKIANLMENKIQVEEKFEMLGGKIKALHEEIVLCVTNLSSELEECPNVNSTVQKIKERCFELMEEICKDIRSTTVMEIKETDINVESKSSPLVELEEADNVEKSSPLMELESSDLKSESLREDIPTEEITSEQTGVCRKLEDLDLQLGVKASLVHYFEGVGEVLGKQETSEDDLNRMKAKIEVLMKEKEALKQALKVSEKRLDEERNRRYAECESEIVSLEKEIRTSKLVKGLKKQTELQITAFKKEIIGLKKARVELVKQMKQDNIKFRRLQKEKEKEVAQLKQRERKKDFEIIKLKNRFEKHMNVLNQKLAKYKQEKRRSLEKSTMRTTKDKKILQKNVNDWLHREMEVVVCSKLTEFHYQNVEDKLKSTEEEINNLRNSCSSNLSEEKQNMLIKEAEHLKSVLEVHKRKLTELKGSKSDFKDEKSEDRWNEINSMAEAKIALGALFKKCVSAEVGIEMQKDLLEQEKDQESFNIHSYEEKIKLLSDEIAELKENMQRMQSNYEDQITKLNLESQCKALDYLKEMNSLTGTASESEKDISLKDQVKFQAQEISRLSQIAKQFDTLNKENENLKEQLFKAKKGKKVNWLYAPTSTSTSATSVPSSSATYGVGESMVEEYLSDDTEEVSYDENDPDWRLTPLAKQRRALKHKNSDDEDRFSISTYVIPAKRITKPCQCPGDCKTMRCACRKRNDICSSNCLCKKDNCVNI